MRILATNDDGIRAEGLAALVRVAKLFGQVKVAAPDHEKSACGHGMTLRVPLRVNETTLEDVPAYEVDGLPVDCVNVGLSVAWPEGCDLVLSGINNGPNLGFDVTYSGTVAGAMEGAINGIPSLAVSMASFVQDAPFHYETGAQWLAENLPALLAIPSKPLTFLNVNIPAVAFPELNGHRFVGMGQRVYVDRVERREDPWGRPYYWQGGAVVADHDQPETDVQAVMQGFVAVTPVSLNWTDRETLREMRE